MVWVLVVGCWGGRRGRFWTERVLVGQEFLGGGNKYAKLYTDGNIVMRGETTFAEADCEAGFAGSGITDADQFCYIVP